MVWLFPSLCRVQNATARRSRYGTHTVNHWSVKREFVCRCATLLAVVEQIRLECRWMVSIKGSVGIFTCTM
jgi:hypothetical protein